jgi:hypothetical protein
MHYIRPQLTGTSIYSLFTQLKGAMHATVRLRRPLSEDNVKRERDTGTIWDQELGLNGGED